MEEIRKKVCRSCKEEKFLYEYYRNLANPDRLNYRCKECTYKARNNTDLIKIRKHETLDGFSCGFSETQRTKMRNRKK